MNVEDAPGLLESLASGLQSLSLGDPGTIWFALAGLAALVVGMLWLLYRSVASITELRRLLGDAALELAESRRALALVEAQRPAERLRVLEEQVAALGKGQEQLLLSDSSTASYLHAIRHAQRGADVEELMRTHGVARAEAELIVALHVDRAHAQAASPGRRAQSDPPSVTDSG
jgi:hypothetical protein